MQDPVQDGVASPATPGAGKSKVTRIQYLTSGLTEEWKGDEWRTSAWVGGGLFKRNSSPRDLNFNSFSNQSVIIFFFLEVSCYEKR